MKMKQMSREEQLYVQQEHESFLEFAVGPIRSWNEWVEVAQKVVALQSRLGDQKFDRRMSIAEVINLVESVE